MDNLFNEDQEAVPNVILDKGNCEIFNVPQRYLIPINSFKDESTSCITLNVPEGTRCKTFYHAFRRWLIANNIPVVQYLYESQLGEVMQCVGFPEEK